MSEHRLQVLLDEARYEKVSRLARKRGISVAAVIRGAIDTLPLDDEGKQAAIAAILAADLMPLPTDPSELRAERDETHIT